MNNLTIFCIIVYLIGIGSAKWKICWYQILNSVIHFVFIIMNLTLFIFYNPELIGKLLILKNNRTPKSRINSILQHFRVCHFQVKLKKVFKKVVLDFFFCKMQKKKKNPIKMALYWCDDENENLAFCGNKQQHYFFTSYFRMHSAYKSLSRKKVLCSNIPIKLSPNMITICLWASILLRIGKDLVITTVI